MSRRNTETETYDILSEYNSLAISYDEINSYVQDTILWIQDYKEKLVSSDDTLHHIGKIHEGKYTSVYSTFVYADPVPNDVIQQIRNIKPLIRKMVCIKQKMKQDTTDFVVALIRNRETAEPDTTGRFIFDTMSKFDLEKIVDIVIRDINKSIIDMANKITGVKDYFIRSKILDSFIDELYSEIDSSLVSICEKVQHEKYESKYITTLIASRMHDPRINNIYL
jgi:hypothetical protein